jgi:hypothetical protein
VNIQIQKVSDDYAKAVADAEVAWGLLRADKFNNRLIFRYIRTLRRCRRLRDLIGSMYQTGAL